MNRIAGAGFAFPRRDFLLAGAAGAGSLLLPGVIRAAADGVPTDNPLSSLRLAWTDGIRWANALDVTRLPGGDIEEKLAAAQAALAARGGGVAYFPAGTYAFKDSIRLLGGIVLRGADPRGVTDARKEGYAPPTRFEFPKYAFVPEGEGTPILRAFKGIGLADPGTSSNCGVVNVALNRGHIHLDEAPGHVCGGSRVVFGCVLRHAAAADPAVPDLSAGQKPWQRFTARHFAAIDVKSAAHVLVANNRLPRSGEDNFTMDGYVLRGRDRKPQAVDGVVFDYDNRPAIYVNHFALGGQGGEGPDGTPETHPFGFRKGAVIRDNGIFNTGRMGIGFSGDGVECRGNVIRFAADVWRPTATGRDATSGSSTNDNRAVEMRGWRWTVDGNDYEVHRNWAFDRTYRINDGEGLMHEDHVNATVRDSALTNNRGNTYLSIYKTAGIEGLRVEGNEIRLGDGRQAIASATAIFVSANRTYDAYPCRGVSIARNVVSGGGILIAGSPAGDNEVRDNRCEGPKQIIRNQAAARISGNAGFEVDETPWQPRKRR